MSLENTLEYRRELIIGSATCMANERLGLGIDRDTMSKIIDTNLDWEVEDEDMIYDQHSPDMDTIVRESVMDCIANFYLGRSWPCGYENVDMNKFFTMLYEAVDKEKVKEKK